MAMETGFRKQHWRARRVVADGHAKLSIIKSICNPERFPYVIIGRALCVADSVGSKLHAYRKALAARSELSLFLKHQ